MAAVRVLPAHPRGKAAHHDLVGNSAVAAFCSNLRLTVLSTKTEGSCSSSIRTRGIQNIV
jgi:hypothetical protein